MFQLERVDVKGQRAKRIFIHLGVPTFIHLASVLQAPC